MLVWLFFLHRKSIKCFYLVLCAVICRSHMIPVRRAVNSCWCPFIRSAKEPLMAHWLHCGSIEMWQRREPGWLIAFCVFQSAALSVDSSSAPPPLSVSWSLTSESVHMDALRMGRFRLQWILSRSKIWAPLRALIKIPASCSHPQPISYSLPFSLPCSALWTEWARGSGYALLLSPSEHPGCTPQAQAPTDRQIGWEAVRECFYWP